MWPCLIKRHFNDDRCISKLIFSNIWPLSVAVGQGYPDVNNNETNYDDEDSNSPCHNCNVLVTEWDKWQDITYLWRQLMMWSVGRLWFPGDHYLPHWPMKPGSAAVNEFISSLYFPSQNAIGNSWFMLVQYRPLSRPSILWPRLDDASYSITESSRTLTAYPTKCRTFETLNENKHESSDLGVGVLFNSCQCRWWVSFWVQNQFC